MPDQVEIRQTSEADDNEDRLPTFEADHPDFKGQVWRNQVPAVLAVRRAGYTPSTSDDRKKRAKQNKRR